LTGVAAAAAMAQAPQDSTPAKKNEPPQSSGAPAIDPKAAPATKDAARSEAYYNFTMGHIYEQQYEATSRPEYATQAIEAYKKAYALDPKSAEIGERLAEMYWKAQRIHEAVAELPAQPRRFQLGQRAVGGGKQSHRAVPRNQPNRSVRYGIGAMAGAALPAEERTPESGASSTGHPAN